MPNQNPKLKIVFFAAVLLGFFGVAADARAASWYVDNAANSANDGMSWTNAWRSFSAINWSNIHPGDSLYISGGNTSKTYTESWAVGASGTAQNPIKISVGQDSGHNGTVIFDYRHLGETTGGVGIFCLRNYITLNGNVNGQSHFEIRNLVNYLERNQAVGINGYGVQGITIKYLTFTSVGEPIWIHGSSGFDIHHNTFRETRGDVAIGIGGASGGWDMNLIHDNDIELAFNDEVPPGGTGYYAGPDGIQPGDGTSIYNNILRVSRKNIFTSTQHPDSIQFGMSRYLKVYNNEFVNIGDSAIDLATWNFEGGSVDINDVRIFNNIFRIETEIDPYSEYIRLYANPGGISSINNLKILNNTFIDNKNWNNMPIGSYGDNPTGSGNEIKNNIFINAGKGDRWFPVWSIEDSSGFDANSFSIDGNIYYNSANTPYVSFRDVDYTAPNWVSDYESHGKTSMPLFLSYAPFSDENNLHLQSSDTAARDAGLNLSSYFTTDKSGTSRPQGSGWDIGAYEYVEGGGDEAAPNAPGGLSIH